MESSAIVIEEVSGTKLRSVTLVGAGLPYRGAAWKTAQRLVSTWYPGNGLEATQQVLGPREAPSSWEGIWRRNMLLRSPAFYSQGGGAPTKIAQPHILRDILDQIFFEGARLRVTWTQSKDETTFGGAANSDRSTFQTITQSVVREGRAATWEFPTDRMDDIAWKIEFEWLGRGGQQQAVVAARDESVAALASQINAAIGNFTSASTFGITKAIPKIASPITLGQLESLADAPGLFVTSIQRQLLQQSSRFQQAVALVNKVANIPAQLANTMGDFAQNTKIIANQYRDTQGRMPCELGSNVQTLTAILRAQIFLARAAGAARMVSRRSDDVQTKVRAFASANPGGGEKSVSKTRGTTPGQIITVHLVKAGDTPQSISQKYYGTTGRVLDLMKANHLPFHVQNLVPGTHITVPVIRTQTGV